MSKHTRTSRRRRIAVGLGATGGGLLAAAFMPMGIAAAGTGTDAFANAAAEAAATAVAGAGLCPADCETVPDPASDFTGVPDLGAGGVANAPTAEGIFDQQLNLDNSALAAQLDYDIDNNQPFSFATLDGIPGEPTGYTGPDGLTPTTDLDPFEDAFLNNNGGSELGTLSTGETFADAQSYDYALNQILTPDQVGQLDGIADGQITSVVTPPVVPDNDPAADLVQIFDHNAFANPVSPDTPTDFLGQLASIDDQFLNAFGLGGPLDQLVDSFTGSFSTAVDPLGGLGGTSADLLTGLTGTGADTLTGLGGTGADAFTNIFADLAGLF